MKQTKKARVAFNEKEDAFELWFTDHDGEWVMESRFKCKELAISNRGSADYIHWSIIPNILNFINLGYELSYKIWRY